MFKAYCCKRLTLWARNLQKNIVLTPRAWETWAEMCEHSEKLETRFFTEVPVKGRGTHRSRLHSKSGSLPCVGATAARLGSGGAPAQVLLLYTTGCHADMPWHTFTPREKAPSLCCAPRTYCITSVKALQVAWFLSASPYKGPRIPQGQ